MASKKRKLKDVPVMGPEQVFATIREIADRHWNIDRLLSDIERDANQCSGIEGKAAEYAQNALRWVESTRQQIKEGNTQAAATYALKAGAVAERLILETLFAKRWMRQKEVVEKWGITRYRVARDVASRKLHTNGRKGQACRVDPYSAVKLYGAPDNDSQWTAEDEATMAQEKEESGLNW